jgi:N-methylhydantoinase A/oxoprolinase/acetone carboxylase beta subunit
MKLMFIGCGIFRDEIEHLAAAGDHEVDCEWLPQGLHAVPETLRRELQAAIDRIPSAAGYQAVLIGYGLCSRGAEGIHPQHAPLVLPRTHDCIGVFLGGHQRYLEQFRRHPGTYWFTRGFIQLGGQPGVKGKYPGIFRRYEEVFEEYRARYGEEIARYLVETWDQKWMGNYSRAAYVAWDYDEADEHRRLTCDCAANLGWDFEELPADLGLLERLLAGTWHPEEFLVVMPGHQTVATHDGRILEAMTPAEAAGLAESAVREESVSFVVGEDGELQRGDAAEGVAPSAHLHEGLGIGLDAGGTYTDAVLYDFAAERVLADGKGLTTPDNPAAGVAEALAALPAERLAAVRLVSLATTFATNAIVEEKGARVGLLLAGYDEWSLARIPHQPRRSVPGSHGADGGELEPLDEAAARAALRELAERETVQALAVVGTFACRNPEHEIRLRELARETCDLPVVCGHELSNDLGAIERAVTAALNARISPVVVDLVRAVERVLDEAGIDAPLTIVRADGSLMQAGEACRRPVEMILSGPAASLCGAHSLTGTEEAVVVDMGGTTSDVARLTGGRPVRGERGAVVGPHRTIVRAPAIRTGGLGGDSHIQVHRTGTVTVGPRRVLPVSYAAHRWAGVAEKLEALETPELAELKLLQPAELYLRRTAADPASHGLSARETRVYEALAEGPLSVLELGRAIDYEYFTCLPLDRLEELGLVMRTGLTPTDLLHADGTFERWDAGAARLALRLAAGRLGLDPAELDARARFVIRQRLVRSLLAAGLDLEGEEAGAEHPDAPFERLLHSVLAGEPAGVVQGALSLTVPVIGIGAPAGAFVPAAAETLQAPCRVPPRAAVAGAVGAITGSVLQAVQILVRPDPAGGGVVMHAPDQSRTFVKLDQAKAFARDHATDLVRRRAQAAGAGAFNIRVHVEDRHGRSAESGPVYIETRITAEAAGAPKVR